MSWSSSYAPRVDDELEALRWLTVDELAAARRRAIKAWNLLDRMAPDYARQQATIPGEGPVLLQFEVEELSGPPCRRTV